MTTLAGHHLGVVVKILPLDSANAVKVPVVPHLALILTGILLFRVTFVTVARSLSPLLDLLSALRF